MPESCKEVPAIIRLRGAGLGRMASGEKVKPTTGRLQGRLVVSIKFRNRHVILLQTGCRQLQYYL